MPSPATTGVDAEQAAPDPPGPRRRTSPCVQARRPGRWHRPRPTPSSATIRQRRSGCASLIARRSCSPRPALGAWAAVHAGWRGTVQRRRDRGGRGAAGDVRRRMPERISSRRSGRASGHAVAKWDPKWWTRFGRRVTQPDQIAPLVFAGGPSGRPHLDLWRATRDQLRAAGCYRRTSTSRAVHEDACRRAALVSRRRGEAGRMGGVIRPREWLIDD